MWLWISRETDLLCGPRRLLHIAPEQGLLERFASADQVTYVKGDIDSPLADVALDLRATPFPTGCFDAIVCSHVLEHIADDRTAMKELARILRPGGWALLMVPFYPERRTDEDPSASRQERLIRFGQEDHVRTYGGDYVDRLHDAGFDVEYEMYGTKFESRFARRHGLPFGEFLIAGWKPTVLHGQSSVETIVEHLNVDDVGLTSTYSAT
ncbi:MAG TPA: methyltransferase domain-containing protein [Actinomycetota bacterium]|nr:methyltransferase domain-containing protein [Actinomycetota bacterium]